MTRPQQPIFTPALYLCHKVELEACCRERRLRVFATLRAEEITLHFHAGRLRGDRNSSEEENQPKSRSVSDKRPPALPVHMQLFPTMRSGILPMALK